MKHKSERYKSRRITPWDDQIEKTPTQEFVIKVTMEHYNQRHPKLFETGEVELINSFVPKKCPYCSSESFKRNGKTKIGVQRYKCLNTECSQTFLPTTGTIFDGHKISISEWIEYCLNLFRNVSVITDSWNNKNAFTTSRYWLEKLFLILEEYQKTIVLSGKIWLDETYYSIMLKDFILNDNGTKLRGLSKNKICIGAATDEHHNVLLLSEGFGKPSQKVSYATFIDHIAPNSILVHDGEKSHKKLISDLSLVDEQHPTKETKGLEDFENPLDPVNHIHYLTKRFLYSHSGFDRSQIQDYLNLYSFILNPPFDKLEKVEILLNLVFQNPKLLRYRDQFNVNS